MVMTAIIKGRLLEINVNNNILKSSPSSGLKYKVNLMHNSEFIASVEKLF